MRTILYTGKGGVGKTSVAAATAVRAAELGYRTVVMSTDPAHSLGDSLDMQLSGELKPVMPNLWAQEVDVLRELDLYWATVRDWLVALLRWQGVDQIVADELAVLPGMEELVGLLYITRYHDSGQYDVLIVDCAPTGETLRLLSFPDVARWYMERIFPIEKRLAAAIAPVMKPILNIPVPDDKVFASMQSLFEEVDKMRRILADPDKSSVRLVMNAEKMVIKETQRTYTYLNLYGYATDVVVCNRIIPERVTDPFFKMWKESQKRYFGMIEEAFSPLPILRAPLMDQEIVGVPALKAFAKAVFGDEDATRLYYHGQAQEIRKVNQDYVLSLPLPFVSREQVSLLRAGTDLVIQAGNQRRTINLPRALATLDVAEAKLDDGKLRVTFKRKTPEVTGKSQKGGRKK